MNMPISRMTREMEASLAKVRAEIDKLGAGGERPQITGSGADGLLKLSVDSDRTVSVTIHPGLVRDDSERGRVEDAVAAAVTEAFLGAPADMPEVEALLQEFDAESSDLIATTQAGLREQLAGIDAYFDGFKARLHGPRPRE